MTTIFFIVQGRRLEAQALLLVATLRQHNGDRFPLIAYVPDGPEALAPPTRDFLDRCGVDLRIPDPAPRPWKKPYVHGNKILATASRRGGGHGLFLDTDMVCAAPLDLAPWQDDSIGLVPEGIASWGAENDRWARAYAHFDLPIPTDRVRLTRRKRAESLPYFNAGMILFPEGRFGAEWLETALDIDHDLRIGGKRPWLDQIALPLTLKRFGHRYSVMPVEYNFSISQRAPEPEARPAILHYHRFRFLADWPQYAETMRAVEQAAGPLHARLMVEFAEELAFEADQPGA
ncbi:hypothetical protein QCN27_11145 [Cereibacter sp. SYSU M97828]|nr:hypothetical protein [Cereibacter flavus]